VVAGTEGPVVLRGEVAGRLGGVRPEDVQIGAAPGPVGLRARVTGVEYLGADSVVTCVAGTESLAVRVQGRAGQTTGTDVCLRWPAEALHVFDGATGRRHQGGRPAMVLACGE
jgi:sn-glycerol 3-phosphate transport system ATP-binding protein